MVRPTGAGDSLATGSVIPVTASRSNGQSSVTIAQSNLLCVIHLNTDLKVERYDDSSTPLDTFLRNYCASYNEWSEVERAAHLCDSLDGRRPNSKIFCEISDDATDADIILLLCNRFGNSNRMERYCAELHVVRNSLHSRRRRERVESFQLSVASGGNRKLVASAFPGQGGEFYEIIGRDAFLTALDDPACVFVILIRNQKNVG